MTTKQQALDALEDLEDDNGKALDILQKPASALQQEEEK